ncbi:MAG: glucose-1-phosphate cytidylyltransferase [Chitinivibrionales bacterium]|nr:glucose-1-phosphate cytidylyltransferase [Chitinivibrionales bacterium]
MKTVILSGGFGTRLAEETEVKPKPMVRIGGKPILWHIMNIYGINGFNEFIIALGYMGESIKEYFLNYYANNSDFSVDLGTGETTFCDSKCPQWKVHLVDTGLYSGTGGRLLRLQDRLKDEECFMLSYGDGVGDIDIAKVLDFHRSHGKLATVTTVRSPSRFGRIGYAGSQIHSFYEKPGDSEGWINSGFFVLSPRVIDYIDNIETMWEKEPVEQLVRDGQLMGFRHTGFWSCMDTLKEKRYLEELWNSGAAPWKVW